MKRALFSIASLIFTAGAVSADVSKEDLKKLLKAGIGDDVILAYVKAQGPLSKMSADDIVDLKQSGASDKLLESLLGKKEEPKQETTPAPTGEVLETEKKTVIVKEQEPIVQRETVYVDRPTTVYVPAPVYTVRPSSYYCRSHFAYDSCGYYPTYSYSYPAYRHYRRYSYPSYSYYSYPSVGFSYYRGSDCHRRSGWSVGFRF